MVVQALSGPIIDTIGRKVAVIFGITIMGVSVGLIPFFTELYPGFFLVRVLMSVGSIICLNIPLLPDYVHKDSIG